MKSFLSLRTVVAAASLLLLTLALAVQSQAQTDDAFGDSGADPVKLFERGQSAHARGDLQKALEFYEQALKVRPEFPEAEFQNGVVLVSLVRLPEAEAAFKRAIALKKNWSLPYSALGALFVKQSRDGEAETMFRQALTLDAQDAIALRLLADLKLRSGATKEALELARKATSAKDAPPSSWVVLAMAERANGSRDVARKILDQILDNEPDNLAALIERADLSTEEKAYDAAIKDLQTADKSKPGDKSILGRLAYAYQQAGRVEEANAAAKAAGLKVEVATGAGRTNVVGTPEEIEAANSDDATIARPALEKLIEKNPSSAFLLAKLGASYRTDKPEKSLELYRRAVEIEPNSPDYAIGYSSALVQARRFADAAGILREVVKAHPDHYGAHANLATALYQMKQYADAIPQYEWLISAKADVVVAYYFIATAHDYLGEYQDALSAYERFLAKADPKINQLEIDKVKLRLPSLRRQIQLGEGAKKKPSVR